MLLVWMAFAVAPLHAEPCRIARSPDIAVTMHGLRPMVRAQINGQDAWFVADSGAFFSFLTLSAVRQFKLTEQSLPNVEVWSIGGHELARMVRVRKFTFIGNTWSAAEFMVTDTTYGSEAVGLLGQNVFRIADVEYDLANGVIRLVRPKGDCKETALAYWAEAANKVVSVIPMEPSTVNQPHTKGVAYLNGTRIHVLFDTGSAQSFLTLKAAQQAGITPDSAGVTAAGVLKRRKPTQTWIGTFSSFKIGAEDIQHAKLRFGDIDLLGSDMLIGTDFFLSHRVYVATSQNRLYFTYNGGPVFDLSASHEPADATAAGPGEPTPQQLSSDAANTLDQPTDAAGFARRAAASEARHDYEAAIADLTRACELDPGESAYFYQRGVMLWRKAQPDAALADFDHAIELKPEDADALIARARLRLSRGAAATELTGDLEAADRALPSQSEARLQIGNLYDRIGQPTVAVAQYSKWIDANQRGHPSMAAALNDRCWSRALTGQELDTALNDCNEALKMKPGTAAFLDSRGLVYLRQGRYEKAIADYDASLQLRPKNAWTLYGRGLAKQGKGMKSEAQSDIAAATVLDPHIATTAAKYGITP